MPDDVPQQEERRARRPRSRPTRRATDQNASRHRRSSRASPPSESEQARRGRRVPSSRRSGRTRPAARRCAAGSGSGPRRRSPRTRFEHELGADQAHRQAHTRDRATARVEQAVARVATRCPPRRNALCRSVCAIPSAVPLPRVKVVGEVRRARRCGARRSGRAGRGCPPRRRCGRWRDRRSPPRGGRPCRPRRPARSTGRRAPGPARRGSRVAGRRDRRVGRGRRAHVDRRRVRASLRVAAEDVARSCAVPVLVKNSEWWRQLGQLAAHAEHREHRARARRPRVPPRLGIGLRAAAAAVRSRCGAGRRRTRRRSRRDAMRCAARGPGTRTPATDGVASSVELDRRPPSRS